MSDESESWVEICLRFYYANVINFVCILNKLLAGSKPFFKGLQVLKRTKPHMDFIDMTEFCFFFFSKIIWMVHHQQQLKIFSFSLF